jgi:NAD(P)-dependent dehydrogenase (short-subunit alcohol dehydrogenase family)
LAHGLIPFFLAKQRGRIVYLMEDRDLAKVLPEEFVHNGQDSLLGLVNDIAREHRHKNVTANALTVGVTDDTLLRIFPKSNSLKKSFLELAQKHQELKLVEFHEIALSAAYLSSALSASLTGQVLRLTHGAHLGAV